MRISSKLNLLVLLAVVLALGPFAVYSLKRSSDGALNEAKSEFRLIGNMALNVLQEGYLSYVSEQVQAVGAHKDRLRNANVFTQKLTVDMAKLPAEAYGQILAGQLSQWENLGITMIRVDKNGRLVGSQTKEWTIEELSFLNWPTVKTGHTLVEKTRSGNVPPDGEVVVIEGAGAQNGQDRVDLLALLRPEQNLDTFVVSFSNLSDVRRQSDVSASSIVRQLSDRLSEVTLPPGASAALINPGREILTSIGEVPDLTPLTDAALGRSAREGPLEFSIDYPQGTILVRLEHFRPLDWYFALFVPQSIVTNPVKRLATRLAFFALLGAAAAYLLSAGFGRKLSGPIAALAKRAQEAAGLDFSSPEAEAFFSPKGAPGAMGGKPPGLGQKRPTEEIGILSDSIDSMGQTIVSNVKDLISVNKESVGLGALDAPAPERPSEEIGLLSHSFDLMGRTIVKNVKDLLLANKARERLDGELAAARSIQMGILPAPGEKSPIEALDLAFVLEPAKEVGGDLFDCFTAADGRSALIIGDVSGKGVPAALFMSMTVTLIRDALLEGRLTAGQAMTRVNKHLTTHNPSSMFVTLFVGLWDPLTGELEYANGGHCQPLIVGPKGLRLLTALSGPIVGVMDELEYETFKDALDPLETTLLYTDGVTEAQDLGGFFFGQERLNKVALEAALEGPKALNDKVISEIKSFRGEAAPYDDVCLLAFRAAQSPPG
ncbi:MAG: PP2C family protein-serine/threonine phosphatase [Deltaproteobacteria bacterium]|jgi:sigma-B regulation protein RsbU (phosphoserine phosphatase)|nr:PP2C family protein-serine/threonine phosphatase [Deltaproteobacteria bacterium]